jgi:cytidylate kinase
MTENKKSMEKFVKTQIEKWDQMHLEESAKDELRKPVITVSSEPGSGGTGVAQGIAKRLGFDYFHRYIVEGIAESAEIRRDVIDTIEKERLSGIEDFIASLIEDQYIYPGIYMEHLLKVIGTIAKHGSAVIVGRGANFIIPPDERISVRVIAPLEVRVQNIARWHKISVEKARPRVIGRESKRRAFVRQSFNAKITDPNNYDLTINTGALKTESAIEAVIGALTAGQGNNS